MPGRLVDLNQPELALPRWVTVDSSLVIARWLAATRPPRPHQAAQATAFFRLLRDSGTIRLVSSVCLHEVLHVTLVVQYCLALPTFQAELTEALPRKRRFDWDDLYKVRPDLMAQFRLALAGLHSFLIRHNLVVIQPDSLGPLPAGQSLEDALLDVMMRYQLDSGDAAILLEAQRAAFGASPAWTATSSEHSSTSMSTPDYRRSSLSDFGLFPRHSSDVTVRRL